MAKLKKYVPKHEAVGQETMKFKLPTGKTEKIKKPDPGMERSEKRFLRKFDQWFFAIILLVLWSLFAYTIRNELSVGNNNGVVKLVATETKNDKASAANQSLENIAINGMTLDEEDFTSSNWTRQSIEHTDIFYLAFGDNHVDEVIEIDYHAPVKNISFDYASRESTGIIKVYVDDEPVQTIDTYSSDNDTKFNVVNLPRHLALTGQTAFWYGQLLVFALASLLFVKQRFYREIARKNILKMGAIVTTSVGSLLLALNFIPEDFFLLSDTEINQSELFISLMCLTIFISVTMRAIKGLIDTKHQYIIHIFYYVFTFATPLLSFYILENTYSRVSTVLENMVIFNLIILYLIWLTLSYITYSLRTGGVLMIATSVITGIINHILIALRNTPLMAYHFYQIKDGLNVASHTEFTLSNRILQTIALSWIIIIILVYLPKVPFKWQLRDIKHPRLMNLAKRSFTLITGMLFAVTLLPLLLTHIASFPKVSMNYFRMQNSYADNGFALGFSKAYLESQIIEPKGYSINAIQTAMEDYPATQQKAKTLPNIIIIQNESQADYEALTDLKFSQDPLEFQHSLTKNTISGETVVSVLGGGTANTEYEVITSNALALFPKGLFPYQQLISEEKRSFASLLGSYGYETVAIHPLYATNYNRQSVYDLIGFDRAYFSDTEEDNINDLFDVEYERGYISDKSLFQGIRHLLEDENRTQPLFNFTVTLQGHGGYGNSLEDYPRTTTILEREDNLEATGFLTTVRSTDQAFKELITFIEDFDEPTMVIMYGDHQPALANTYFASELDEEKDKAARYRTPLIMWANFDLPEETDVIMSPNYVVPYALNALSKTDYGLAIPSFYRFLYQFHDAVPVMTTWGYLDENSKYLEALDENASYYKDYQLYSYLQYNNAIAKSPLFQYFE